MVVSPRTVRRQATRAASQLARIDTPNSIIRTRQIELRMDKTGFRNWMTLQLTHVGTKDGKLFTRVQKVDRFKPVYLKNGMKLQRVSKKGRVMELVTQPIRRVA